MGRGFAGFEPGKLSAFPILLGCRIAMGSRPLQPEPPLPANAKPLNQSLISFRAAALQILQKPATPSHHGQQTSPRVMVLIVRLEMLGEFSDTLAQERNLHFRRAGVRFVDPILSNRLVLDVYRQRHARVDAPCLLVISFLYVLQDSTSPLGRKRMQAGIKLEFHPVTPGRWADFERLFGARGACGGCWCMWWRLKRSEYEKQKGAGNRRAMKKLVDSEQVPGLLAYSRGEPVAWCSVAPREEFPVLERSRVLKRVDDKPVWSVVCLFVAKSYRRKGLTAKVLEAAVEYAKRQGAAIVEGYPTEPRKPEMPDVFAATGLASAFRKAGFTEVARRSDTRPIMRRSVLSGRRRN